MQLSKQSVDQVDITKTGFEAKSCCSLLTDLAENVTCPRSFIEHQLSGYSFRVVKHWLIWVKKIK